MKSYYRCQKCEYDGPMDEVVLSLMYRPKHDNFQSFLNIKCPKCVALVTILFETLDACVKN